MTPVPFSSDEAHSAHLRRIKRLASASLVASLVLLVVAKLAARAHPAFGFVAAFAEAATIGGLADWYAVVALFRRPLGLPIPHTAIIPRNQHRIADKLGEFVEMHFLSPALVTAKLREVNFAGFAAEWLDDADRSANLAQFILRLLPDMLNAAESSGLKTFLTRRIVTQIATIDVAPLAAGLLEVVTADNRHQRLLDDVLGAFSRTLTNRDTLSALRDKIRDELPTLLVLYKADAYLLKKIVASTLSFVDEVRGDPAHPFRAEFDRFVRSFVERFSTSLDYEHRLDQLKRDLLARPEVADLGRRIWDGLRTLVGDGGDGPNPLLRHHLQAILVDAGRQLASDPALGAEVNKGVVAMVASFIETQKSGVSSFIADQVKAWDLGQLVHLIEINVGADLQYIRFNGAVIGGCAGLGLYAMEQLLRLV